MYHKVYYTHTHHCFITLPASPVFRGTPWPRSPESQSVPPYFQSPRDSERTGETGGFRTPKTGKRNPCFMAYQECHTRWAPDPVMNGVKSLL